MDELKFIDIDSTVKANITNHGFKPTRIAIPKAGEYYYNPNHGQPVCCKTNRNRGMLFIICEKSRLPVKQGQIYFIPEMGSHYMVVCSGSYNGINTQYILANLESGGRYSDAKPLDNLLPSTARLVNKKIKLV